MWRESGNIIREKETKRKRLLQSENDTMKISITTTKGKATEEDELEEVVVQSESKFKKNIMKT